LVNVAGVGDALSINSTVNWNVPAWLGVPLIVPVVVPIGNKPGGNVPVVDQEYGGIPPPPARVWLYTSPIAPLASPLVVIVSGARSTASVKDPVCVTPLESVTVTLKVELPGDEGAVPVKTPPPLSIVHGGNPVPVHV
jgi:hypothetical protein